MCHFYGKCLILSCCRPFGCSSHTPFMELPWKFIAFVLAWDDAAAHAASHPRTNIFSRSNLLWQPASRRLTSAHCSLHLGLLLASQTHPDLFPQLVSASASEDIPTSLISRRANLLLVPQNDTHFATLRCRLSIAANWHRKGRINDKEKFGARGFGVPPWTGPPTSRPRGGWKAAWGGQAAERWGTVEQCGPQFLPECQIYLWYLSRKNKTATTWP